MGDDHEARSASAGRDDRQVGVAQPRQHTRTPAAKAPVDGTKTADVKIAKRSYPVKWAPVYGADYTPVTTRTGKPLMKMIPAFDRQGKPWYPWVVYQKVINTKIRGEYIHPYSGEVTPDEITWLPVFEGDERTARAVARRLRKEPC